MYEMFIVKLYYCGAKNYMNDQFETKLHDCQPVKKTSAIFFYTRRNLSSNKI